MCNCTPHQPSENCPYGMYLFDHITGHFKILTSADFLLLLQDAKEAIHTSYTFWVQHYSQHVQQSVRKKRISQQQTTPLRTTLRNLVRLKEKEKKR